MSSHKIGSLVAAIALLATVQQTSDAQYYSGSYTTFYAPYTSYYSGGYSSGYAPASQGCCGSGSYTANYGGGYGGNAFAPLVPAPGPRYGLFGLFGRGNRYTAAYGGYGSSGCGCSPCSSGGCASGNCGMGGCAAGNCGLTNNQPLKPSPDEPPMGNGNLPKTYDEDDMPPMDDPGFRSSDPEDNSDDNVDDNADDSFPGAFDSESLKPATDDTPASDSQPIVPLDANPTSVPADQFNISVPKPITPRNSAQREPSENLEHRITWRSSPVLVPGRKQLAVSRPLIVRQTVRVLPTKPLTVVSQSRVVK